MKELESRPRRRRWSADDKRAAVDLAFGEGGDVTAIAASLGVEPNRIHAWRRQLEATDADLDRPLFLPAVVTDGNDPGQQAQPAIAGDAGVIFLRVDEVPITIGRGAEPAVVSALIAALRES